MGFKPHGSWVLSPFLSQALFSAPVVPKKVESETKKSDDESEEVAPDRVALGVGGGPGCWDESGQIRSWPQTRPGTWNGGLVREIPDNFRENLGWWNNIVWQWMDKRYIFT